MLERLQLTNTYDIITIVPWQRKVIFDVMYLSGIGTYSILPDKESVIRELGRIEHTLPAELQNNNWVNGAEDYYIFNTETSTGRQTISIPVNLVNHDTAKELSVINQPITIHADNIRQLNNVYRLLRDNGISFTTEG